MTSHPSHTEQKFQPNRRLSSEMSRVEMELKRWTPLDVARHGAVALEDLAIESVSMWAGSTEDYAVALHAEIFDEDGNVRHVYLCAGAELMRHSLVRNDPKAVAVAITRVAANQHFLRTSMKNHAHQ